MATVSKRRWTSPDGSEKSAWTVRYKDGGGSFRQRTFDRKKEADAYRIKVEGEMMTGVHVAGLAALTIDKLATQYFTSRHDLLRDGRLSRGTMQKDQCYYDAHIKPHLGAVILRDLQTSAIDEWLHTLRKTKANRAARLAPGTVKAISTILARIIDYGQRRKFVGANIARDVMRWDEHRRYERAKIRTFSPEEARRLIATVAGRPENLSDTGAHLIRCAVYLAAFCGLRHGEVMGLTWANVDFEAGVIRVRHSLDQFDDLRTTKTPAGIRDVPMPEMLADQLKAWRERSRPTNRGLVFRGKMGVHIKSPNFHKNYWQVALRAAGLEEFDDKGRRYHFHALRHFCASMLIAGGIPMPDVAVMLGHEHFDMTLQVYAHPIINPAQRHGVIENIAAQLRMSAPALTCNDTHETATT